MKELNELYAQMGISPAVYAYGEETIARLRERFDAIDQVAEYNQAKVLAAFRKNRVLKDERHERVLSANLGHQLDTCRGVDDTFTRISGIRNDTQHILLISII